MKRVNGHDYDVIIVGAGMVGACLAHALRPVGLSVCLVEAIPPKADHQPSFDDRSLALSISSRHILTALGLWDDVVPAATPIQRIHVSDQHRPGMVRLTAREMGVDALGHVLSARHLGQALLKNLQQNVQAFICPASVVAIDNRADSVAVTIAAESGEQILNSRLLVLADGSRSRTREMCHFERIDKAYGQTAIVSNVLTELPHQNTAFERFTAHGPLALLPAGPDHMAMVFTVNSADAQVYLDMNDDAFVAEVQRQFGRRLGRLRSPGKRSGYEITLQHVKHQYRGRALLLGNSAHTLHPNAAQGFNLALRDVAGLAEVLAAAKVAGADPGGLATLQCYSESRRSDQLRVLRFTDGLARLFYTTNPCLTVARNSGLLLAGLVPALRRRIMRLGAGLGARLHRVPG